MGVYIKNIKKPKSCQYCRVGRLFGMAGGVECLVAPSDHMVAGYGDFSIPDWCPLIPVQPHGRLIDADALLSVDRQIYDGDAAIGKRRYITFDEIEDAQTIIPAEQPKEEEI